MGGPVVIFGRAYQPLPPGTKIVVMPQLSYMPEQFVEKNEKEPKFDLFFLPSQNISTYSQSFLWPNVFGYRLEIA